MKIPELDHLVVGAPDLAAGTAALEQFLGITFGPGGEHPTMATHNRLTRVAPTSYLEIIAPDPACIRPSRPRWFGLDDPATAERLRRGPSLLTWVVRVPDLDAALARSPVDLGRALHMTRGSLAWRIAVRDNGSLPDGGTVPILIEWPDGAGPAASIGDGGLKLTKIQLTHPEPDRLRSILSDLGVNGLAEIVDGHTPAVAARFSTPDGREVRLG